LKNWRIQEKKFRDPDPAQIESGPPPPPSKQQLVKEQYKYTLEIAELNCRMSAIEERIEKLEDTRKKIQGP